MRYLQKEYGDKVRRELTKSLRDFHTCKMLEHETIESYEWKVKYLLEHLKQLGCEVPDHEAVRVVLNNLPDKLWEHVRNYECLPSKF